MKQRSKMRVFGVLVVAALALVAWDRNEMSIYQLRVNTVRGANDTDTITIVNPVALTGTLDIPNVTVDAGAGIDTATAGSLNVGVTTATSVNIGKTTKVTTVKGTLNVDEAVTLDTTLGVTGVATLSSNVVVSLLTASKPVFTDASKNLVSTGTLAADQGGTGAATLTDGGVLLGSGTAAVTALGVLPDGSIIVGDGATDPVALAAFSSSTGTLKVGNGGTGLASGTSGGVLAYSAAGTLVSSAALAQYGIVLGGGAGFAPATLAASANTGAPLLSAGNAANPAYGPLNLAGGATIVSGAVPVANGGTALTAGTSGGILAYTATGTLASSALLTQYGPIIGGGAGAAPSAIAVGTDNQVLKGATGAAPAFGALVDADVPNALTLSGSTFSGLSLCTYGIGVPVAGAASAVEYGDGVSHQTVITITNVSLVIADGAFDDGEKVYDFPEGRILIEGVTANLISSITANFNAAANDKFVMAAGTTTTSVSGDGALQTTEVDILPSTQNDTVSGTVTAFTNGIALAASAQFDGTGTAKDVFVNMGIPAANDSGANTNTVTGTITITWKNLGDY